jgi:hypothetical protein
VLGDFDKVWPGIKSQYTGRALVSNWWDNPYSRGAFIAPDIGAIRSGERVAQEIAQG